MTLQLTTRHPPGAAPERQRQSRPASMARWHLASAFCAIDNNQYNHFLYQNKEVSVHPGCRSIFVFGEFCQKPNLAFSPPDRAVRAAAFTAWQRRAGKRFPAREGSVPASKAGPSPSRGAAPWTAREVRGAGCHHRLPREASSHQRSLGRVLPDRPQRDGRHDGVRKERTHPCPSGEPP